MRQTDELPEVCGCVLSRTREIELLAGLCTNRGMVRLIFAFSASALASTCAMVLWYVYVQFATFDSADPFIWIRTRGFFALCCAISAAHVAVLGIPAYVVLRWRSALRWWIALLSGFVLGAVPVGVLSWPLHLSIMKSTETVNGIMAIIDRVPTVAGWLEYLGVIAIFGGCGALSAATFWVAQGICPNNSSKRTPLRGAA